MPRPTVSYAKNMPDIETLMQEWPPEVEEMLNAIKLPDGVFHPFLVFTSARAIPSGAKITTASLN